MPKDDLPVPGRSQPGLSQRREPFSDDFEIELVPGRPKGRA
jgi:hypothetical protein